MFNLWFYLSLMIAIVPRVDSFIAFSSLSKTTDYTEIQNTKRIRKYNLINQKNHLGSSFERQLEF